MPLKPSLNQLLLLILSFVGASIHQLQGQSITVRGRVIHASDGLSYATVFTENLSAGTSADTAGYFELEIPSPPSSSKLVISCLGYSPRTIEVPPRDTVMLVELSPLVQILKEITVYAEADSAKAIIEKMLNHVRNNYPNSPYEAKVFYSEAVKQGSTFVKTTDAFLRLQDRGYNRPLEQHGSILFKVEQLRKRGENPDLNWLAALQNWFYERNGVYLIMKDDPIRNKKKFNWFEVVGSRHTDETVSARGSSFLASSNFLEGYDFRIDSTGTINNQKVYCLSFFNDNHNALSVGEGNLYIQKHDFALVEYRARLIKTRTKDPLNWNLYVPVEDSILYECHAKYKNARGKYFLYYLATKSLGNNSGFLTRDHRQGNDGVVYQYKQLLVESVLTKGFKKIKSGDSYPIDEDLADSKTKYDDSFWKNQQTLPGGGR